MAGVSAAIAIPAFIKYLRKAKTVEAIQGLDQIKAGAKAFYQADHYDP
jgi:Tfp pilus assembly major pilin PilA